MNRRSIAGALALLMLSVMAWSGCLIRTQQGADMDTQLADLQARVNALEQRNAELRQEYDSLQQRFNDSSRIAGQAVLSYEQLESELSILQGRFEEATQGNQVGREQIESMRRQMTMEMEQMKKRVAALEGHQVYTPEGSADETEALNQAVALFNQGNLEAAKAKFREFMLKYKQSKKRDQAQFYLAECLFKQRNWEQAILEYDNLLSQYPETAFAAAAMLHMGISFYESGNVEDAKLFFQRVLQLFPGTREAEIAQKKLEMME